MQKNKNVIIVEKDVKVAKGVYLSEGDAFVKTRNGWMLVEAEGDADEDEDEKKVEEDDDEDEKKVEEDDDEDMDEEDEDEKVVEKKKK